MSVLTILDEYLLTNILSICNIPTVLSISQTCRILYALAFSKFVWLSLVADINARIPLDLPSGSTFESLDTRSLIDLVKRAVRGPRSWSASSPSPTIRYRQVVHLQAQNHHTVILLQGDRYMLYRSHVKLECWSILEDQCVWKYVPEGRRNIQSIRSIGEETVENGKAVVIMVCSHLDRGSLVEFIHLDLVTMSSRQLHALSVANTEYELDFGRPMVCGDLGAVGFVLSTTLILINWRTGLHILFPVMSEVYDVAMIPRHILLFRDTGRPWGSALNIWSADCLEGFWRSGSVLLSTEVPRSAVSQPTIPPLLNEPIHSKFGSIIPQKFSVNASPLDKDSYNVWIIAMSEATNIPGRPHTTVISHFKIECHQDASISLREIASNDLDQDLRVDSLAWCGTTYSGHVMLSHTPRNGETALLTSLSDLSKQDSFDHLAHFPDALQISTYSGALVHLVGGDVVTVHYE